jgi:membrane-bound lytic murein transglycosylase B
MIRRALLSLVPLALAACAAQPPQSSPPPPQVAVAPAPRVALLPPVPQPAERPVAPASVSDPAISEAQRRENFVAWAAQSFGVDANAVRTGLAQAQFKQNIIDAMNRPAEAVRPWRDYRPIFLTQARIDGGRAFYARYRADLDRIAAQSGVPAEIIVAIIGVETMYGGNAGKYRALDALSTLAFGYPKRAPFFAAELAQLFALAKEEGFDPATPVGSYAGAMGWGQFMPSSWRNWGRDGDGDGRRDLISDPDDVFASIANYFVAHGWQRGAPVAGRADKAAGAPDFVPPDPKALDPVYPLVLLESKGYRLRTGEPRADGAVVVALDGDAGREYWLGYRNFYVITRYNHSPMYAMAVWQLSQAIAEAPQSGATQP